MDSFVVHELARIRTVLEDHADSIPTLRDQFAMAALVGLLSQNARTDESPWNDYEDIAEEAFGLADVMMKARETA